MNKNSVPTKMALALNVAREKAISQGRNPGIVGRVVLKRMCEMGLGPKAPAQRKQTSTI